MAFVPTYACFVTYYVRKVYVKIQLFVTAESDQDPDSDPHWLGSLDRDPDLH